MPCFASTCRSPGGAPAAGTGIDSSGIVNIVYGALNAFAQDNVKRRIARSSVSHMGFVLLGIGAIDSLGMSGAMLQMISHGLIAAAMFFTGVFYERTKPSRSPTWVVWPGPADHLRLLCGQLPGLTGVAGHERFCQ